MTSLQQEAPPPPPPISSETRSPSGSAANFLYPLSEFFACPPPQDVVRLEGQGKPMPEPYRSLLVHERDMTSTLERFHEETLVLRPVVRKREGDNLFRQVVLIGERTGTPWEFGAIRIDLGAFGAAARGEILAARRPLGSILARHEVAYESRPRHYFQVPSDQCMGQLLDFSGSCPLYGRQNVLSSPTGRPLAEVVEILPPIPQTLAG